MEFMAKALDILQGEKHISIGYFLLTLIAVKNPLNCIKFCYMDILNTATH